MILIIRCRLNLIKKFLTIKTCLKLNKQLIRFKGRLKYLQLVLRICLDCFKKS